MSIEELIKKLQEYDPKLPVRVRGYGYGEGPANDIYLVEEEPDFPHILISM